MCLVASAFVRLSPEDGREVGSNDAVLCAGGQKSTRVWEEMRCAAMHWTNACYHEGSYRVVFQSIPL